MYKITVYVPLNNKEDVKNAMFQAGGGKIGNYDSCSFETTGKGQFRALEGSSPHIGSLNNVEYVDEVRLEMVCKDGVIQNVVDAMRRSHPYETPAYEVIKLEKF